MKNAPSRGVFHVWRRKERRARHPDVQKKSRAPPEMQNTGPRVVTGMYRALKQHASRPEDRGRRWSSRWIGHSQERTGGTLHVNHAIDFPAAVRFHRRIAYLPFKYG